MSIVFSITDNKLQYYSVKYIGRIGLIFYDCNPAESVYIHKQQSKGSYDVLPVNLIMNFICMCLQVARYEERS